MSVKQSRNVESGSEVVEEDAEEFYSPEVKSRVTHFNQCADDISAQIDDLISVGCEVIESLRRRFVTRMECVKEELLNGVQSQNSAWEDSSRKSLDDLDRLVSIKDLVKSLGLDP